MHCKHATYANIFYTFTVFIVWSNFVFWEHDGQVVLVSYNSIWKQNCIQPDEAFFELLGIDVLVAFYFSIRN